MERPTTMEGGGLLDTCSDRLKAHLELLPLTLHQPLLKPLVVSSLGAYREESHDTRSKSHVLVLAYHELVLFVNSDTFLLGCSRSLHQTFDL